MLKTLFYFLVVALTLGQFSAIYKQGDTNLYLFDLAILLFSTIGYIHFFLIKKTFKLNLNSIFFIAFFLIALISFLCNFIIYSSEETTVGAFYLIRFFSYLSSAFILNNMLIQKEISKDEVLSAFIFSGVFLVLAGFVQLILLPDFEKLDPALGWDPHKNRMSSTFFDPNFLGAYLFIVLNFLFNKLYVLNEFKWKNILLFILILVGIFLSFSRSAWAMLAVTVFIFGLFRSKKLLIVSLIIAFSAYFAVPRVQTRITGTTDPQDSASFRLISWKNTLSIFSQHPYIGVGFNFYRYAQKDLGLLEADNMFSHSGSGSDSSFLFVMATTGILGLIVFLITYFLPLLDNSKNKKDIELKLAILLGLLIGANFNNLLFYPQIMFLFLILGVSNFLVDI